jgi:hypothetical protein
MSRPSILLRALGRLVRVASLSVFALAAVGCEEEPGKKGPVTAADPAEQGRIEQGKKLIADAREAFSDKKYDDARKMLRKAAELNVESQRFEIEEATDKVDKRQAKLWANEVDEDFKNKKCANAFKQLSEPLKTLADSEAFTRELRRLVGTDALKCLQEELDQRVLGGAYADARKMINDADTKTVLGGSAWKKLSAELEATILEAIRGQIAGDLKARKWAQVSEKLEAAAKKGDATEEQVASLIEGVREGVTPEIVSLATKSVTQRDAPAALRQVDQLIKLARWDLAEPGAGVEGGGGRVLPEELAVKRHTLAIWVEAQHLAMRSLGKPEARWTHGKVQVFPPTNAGAPSKRDIPHGTQVWILGIGKDRALVTTTDPGTAPLATLLEKVIGWAPTDRLAKESTADWLVPDEQLKGERVWGPLRPPDGLLELGVVVDVVGKDITVQRLADGQNLKLTRAKLRSGRLPAGTRVLTFCVAKDQPAKVIEVPPSARVAKLKCDGGQEKEEDLASLRTKPELLPTTR